MSGRIPQEFINDLLERVDIIDIIQSRVKLIKRMLKSKDSWGADGWDAQVIYKKDVDKLIKHGVPYKKKDKPLVWVFDFQIVNK